MAEKPGPKTPEGIAISSQNARTHGMTSTILLLPTESQDDLDAHIAQWHLLYPTTNEITQRLVTRAAQSEWHLLRLERQFNTASSQLLATPITDWDESHHKLYQNIQRYLTTGQRAHHRDRLNIQQYRAEIRCEEAHQARMENARASSAELPSFKPPVPPYDFHVNQDISLELDANGQPYANIQPSNEHLLELTDKFLETSRFIRRIRLKDLPVAPGYEWVLERLGRWGPDYDMLFLTMTAKSFRIAVERENGGPMQHHPDLLDLDKQILDSKVKGPPCQPRIKP